MKNKLYILTAVACLAFLVCMVLAAIVIAYPALGMSVPLISGAGLSLLLGFAGIAVIIDIRKHYSQHQSDDIFDTITRDVEKGDLEASKTDTQPVSLDFNNRQSFITQCGVSTAAVVIGDVSTAAISSKENYWKLDV